MSTPTTSPGSTSELRRMLQRWRDEGLLDASQVARIEAIEAARSSAPSPAPAPVSAAARRPARGTGPRRPGSRLIGEALGYVGTALIVAAAGVLMAREWDRLAFGVQVGMAGAAAILTLLAGGLLPDRMGAPGRRLRAVMWTVSIGLAFGLWVIAAGDDGFGWSVNQRLIFAAALATVQAALVWWRSRAVLLHLATFATLAILIAAASEYATFLHDESIGTGLFVFAAAWVVLGVLDMVRPPLVAYLAGALLAVNAGLSTTGVRWGAIFVLVTSAAVVGFAVWQRSLAVLVVGTYGVLSGIPAAANRLFPGSLQVAFGLLIAGLVLVASALWITRRSVQARRSEVRPQTGAESSANDH